LCVSIVQGVRYNRGDSLLWKSIICPSIWANLLCMYKDKLFYNYSNKPKIG